MSLGYRPPHSSVGLERASLMDTASFRSIRWLGLLLGVFHTLSPVASQPERVEAGLEWWQRTIIYQVYPRSFQDSDGDGVGDIQGIISRLDHFAYLNIETIWLSPIFRSPMADFGYDISNHTDIDPIFGTLSDMDELISELHRRGMKLLLDYVPNHTSDEHPWFLESRKGGLDNPYRDYYLWSTGRLAEDGTRQPPNNWLSIFGGPAWEWDNVRQAYYYHQFVKEQPDLNYRNPAVRKEMEDILRFWIERGVDGFRIDAIATMFEVDDLSMDEPRSYAPGFSSNQWPYLQHIFTEHHTDIHVVARSWRRLMDEYEDKSGKHIFMVMEVYNPDLSEAMKYYHSGADMPFNFNLIDVDQDRDARWFHEQIQKWMASMPKGKWPCFVLGNHDQKRISTRKGALYTDVLNMMLVTLPGTPTTYQGEEIGQLDITVSYKDTQDPWGKYFGEEEYMRFSRDPSRGPVQWNDSINAGFSSAPSTWLPVSPDYKTRNIETQKGDPFGKSSLQIYRKVAQLRKEASFQNSQILYGVVNNNILSYIRHTDGHPAYLVAVNLGREPSTDSYIDKVRQFSDRGIIVLSRVNSDDNLREGELLSLEGAVTLHPGEGVIVRLGDSVTLVKTEL